MTIEESHYERDENGKRILMHGRYEPVGEPVPWKPARKKNGGIKTDG